MRRGGRRPVFRNVTKPSKKKAPEKSEEDREVPVEEEEEEAEFVSQDMWNSLWLKILEDLRDDEYLFGMFRESLHRTLDKMNPLISYYSSGMGIEMLEKVLMECQLLSVTSYPYVTQKQVEDIKEILNNINNKTITETPREEQREDDPKYQIHKRLEWGASIREIRIGNFEVQRSWLRQFALKLNTSIPTPSLDVTMFKFMPEDLPSEINRSISKGPTRELMQHFMRQFNRFEVSRVLRMRILLDNIEGINFFHSEKNDSFGLLTFLLKKPPTFSSRRISSSTSLHNEWKDRVDFTTKSQASKFNRIYLCGDYEELETIVTALIALNPNYRLLLTSGIQDIGDDTTKYDTDDISIPPLASDATKIPPLPYSFIINNLQPEQESLLHSDIDSDTDEPEWLGWSGPNDDNRENEEEEDWEETDEFLDEFKRTMHMGEDFDEEEFPEDIDEEEAEEFIEQLHHLGIDPSHLFSQMAPDEDDEDGPYDDEDDEEYEEDDDEGPYHRGHRGPAQPQCAQQ